jgi:cullin 1
VSQDEKLSTKQTVDEDRKHAVEASIVRVMKARKTMPHQQLVMEVSQQLMKLFKPDPKVIKNRIESLISREVTRFPYFACACLRCACGHV